MTRTSKILLALLVVTVLVIGVGYAAIQNVTLNVGGEATGNPSDANFNVKFTGVTGTSKQVSAASDAATVTATVTNDTNAQIAVEGLTAKGDVVTAAYKVQNVSSDLSTDLTVNASIDNEEYFTIETRLGKTSLTAGETTTLLVTIELIKTPIIQSESATIELQLTAEPVQPGEEQSSEGSSEGGTGGTTTGNLTTEGTYLPTGFSEVIGTSLATGLTIQDSTGNQYVWIEVPQTAEVYPKSGLSITAFTDEEYTKIENDLHAYTSVYRNGTTYTDTHSGDDTSTGLTSDQYTELKQKMLKSVYQNGGFYIGKYETGYEATSEDEIRYPSATVNPSVEPQNIPVIKKNIYPYNWITCSQAQTLASRMESGEYTSSLMFGVQWDLVLKYLETKAVEKGANPDTIRYELNSSSTYLGNYSNNNWTISNTNSKYSTDGISWTNGLYNGTGSKGNTSTGILLSTGAGDDFSKQGIYDLAGNVEEFTLENDPDSTTGGCVLRGGACYLSGSGFGRPLSGRISTSVTSVSPWSGFRVALY